MPEQQVSAGKRFGFISTRFAGTDGVTLEARKWAQVLTQCSHECYWFAGRLDTPPDQSMLVPEAFFEHEENLWINDQIFGKNSRSRECTRRIQQMKDRLKDSLHEFIDRFKIDVLIAQNCLTIPMHVPLGLALTEVIVENRLPTIAHHHDFYWERDRYAITAVPDYLQMSFPPRFMNVQHVVINSSAREQLAYRTGITSLVIPNILDFSAIPPEMDAFSSSFRSDIGLSDDDILILQPTRIVARKGIEHAIELVRRLENPRYKLIISHDAGDEGMEYQEFLTDYAASVGVDMRIIARKVSPEREVDKQNNKHYSLWDVYQHADMVTYPSLYEGFGNAFLEAVYFRKPLLVNRYSIYVRDIEPKGFRVIKMNGYITRSVVSEVRKVLEDARYRQEVVAHNFDLGKKYYSYKVLQQKIEYILSSMFGLE
ncbi:MAG: glycosyltransferase family 4 protein [Sedimentisphaerales bacterium]|nr:glycosyltransferase family 4 protein [Sedimentisphaerales bacterium]